MIYVPAVSQGGIVHTDCWRKDQYNSDMGPALFYLTRHERRGYSLSLRVLWLRGLTVYETYSLNEVAFFCVKNYFIIN